MKPTFITPFNKAPFVREERYFVLKISDMRKYLSREKFELVGAIAEKLNAGRAVDGKSLLQAVVVEHDWPEYERVWQMIETRVTTTRRNFLNCNNDRRFWPIAADQAQKHEQKPVAHDGTATVDRAQLEQWLLAFKKIRDDDYSHWDVDEEISAIEKTLQPLAMEVMKTNEADFWQWWKPYQLKDCWRLELVARDAWMAAKATQQQYKREP